MQQVFPANSQVKDDAGEAANPTRGLHNVGPLRSLRHNKCDCDPVAIYQSLEKNKKLVIGVHTVLACIMSMIMTLN